MSAPQRTRRTPGQIVGAALAGASIGFAGGAALAGGLPGVGTFAAAGIGAGVMGGVSGWADLTRRPGRPQRLWVRILASAMLGAIVGWLLQLLLPDWPAPAVGAVVGLGAGALGVRAAKAAVGAAVGVAIGWLFQSPMLEAYGWSVIAVTTVIAYRGVAALLYRGREQVRFLAEGVAPQDVPFVVPLAETQGYVGADYLERYARRVGASFARNPIDIGIVDSVEDLAGPSFDPAAVHPLVREFYEHTSRFGLVITPRWRWWMRLPYRVYRKTVARPLGQANAPFNLEEVERGVLSWIDTIDIDRDGTPEFRAWVRVYADSGELLYVGIYTVVRVEEIGYVSVGFPLPAGSFTATLIPSNHRGDGLLLSTLHGEFHGHYLTVVDSAQERVTVAKLASFDEEIEVYVVDGALRSEHRFMLGGIEFMSLHYEIERTDGS